MGQIFISHVQEDQSAAEQIARGLEAKGYSTWYFERDSDPGQEYLFQVSDAIKSCKVVLVLISPQCTAAYQIQDEVLWARERQKPRIPVFFRMSRSEWEHDPPKWDMALGIATSIEIADERVDKILPRLLTGLEKLGVEPTPAAPEKAVGSSTPPSSPEQMLPSPLPLAGLSTVWPSAYSAMLGEDEWMVLIELIRRKDVIPVIGSDLIRIPIGEGTMTYEQYVGQQLAHLPDYRISEGDLAPLGATLENATLNDVISVCVKKRPDRWPIDLHGQLWRLASDAQLAVPPALTQLAHVTDFDLYVTTSFDPMMEQALQRQGPLETRSYGGARADDVEDLRGAREQGRRVLYYLFGKAAKANYDFGICDLDRLRLLIMLHDSKRRPKRLFDQLKEKHLLFLGVASSDWFSRSFLWLVRDRVSAIQPARALREYVVSPSTAGERSVVLFLEHFSRTSRVVGAQPDEFVAELYKRWSEEARPVAPRVVKPTMEMPEGATFLSFSRADRASAEVLYAALSRAGISVWYDAGLGAGAIWEDKLRGYIQNCSAFIPLISKDALRRAMGWFRREWYEAVEEDKKDFGTARSYIFPVVVDEDDEILNGLTTTIGLPKEFAEVQMYHCPGGNPSGRLIEHLRSVAHRAAGSES
jgi:hypothetical protein